MLSVMPEPAATIFAVAAFTGLRRGEIQGLRREDYGDGQIRVSRAVWEGHVNDPKTGRSKGAVPVIKHVAERLEFQRMRCGVSQNGPMFRNLSSKPVCLNNALGRQILPALKRCVARRRSSTRKLGTISSWARSSRSGTGGTRYGGDWAAICISSGSQKR